MSAGVMASFASYAYKALTRQPGLSLGASGAIMAILAYVCAKYPDTQLSIIFLPMVQFSAGAVRIKFSCFSQNILTYFFFAGHQSHYGYRPCRCVDELALF
jgi:rhomboid-like protein